MIIKGAYQEQRVFNTKIQTHTWANWDVRSTRYLSVIIKWGYGGLYRRQITIFKYIWNIIIKYKWDVKLFTKDRNQTDSHCKKIDQTMTWSRSENFARTQFLYSFSLNTSTTPTHDLTFLSIPDFHHDACYKPLAALALLCLGCPPPKLLSTLIKPQPLRQWTSVRLFFLQRWSSQCGRIHVFLVERHRKVEWLFRVEGKKWQLYLNHPSALARQLTLVISERKETAMRPRHGFGSVN